MTDIVAFLAAQLDAEAALARDAEDCGTGTWEQVAGPCGPEVHTAGDVTWTREVPGAVWDCDDYSDYEGCADARAGWMRQAEHIARWGPERVLREVAAKRRVLARHHVPEAGSDASRYWPNHCVGCGYGYYGDQELCVTEDINDCPELRDIAAIYDTDYAYFTRCPICGESATEPGITDHECDPNLPPPPITGLLALFATERDVGPSTITGSAATLPVDLGDFLRATPGLERPTND